MPTIRLQWWLGNQMFEYALAYALSQKHKEDILFDGTFLENKFFMADWTFRSFELNVFGIQKKYLLLPNFMNRMFHPIVFEIIRKIQFWKKYLKEKNGWFIESIPENCYLDGWFQSYRYFEEYSTEMKQIFTVQTLVNLQNQEMLEKIATVWGNSVSLHVRRGDYVSLSSANKWHGVCSIGYYETAIKQIQETLGSPVFFVFSDDIGWCKENIHFPDWIEALYVDYNGNAGHEDMRLMYSCSHHIIANSSFSWWWAFLGRNPDKVIIAPKKWLETNTFSTQNLLPPSWILL